MSVGPTALPLGALARATGAAPPAVDREAALAAWLRRAGSALVGFSGGVDSAYLAVVARDVLGASATLAVIGRSASFPAEQWGRARAVAVAHDVPLLELDTDELEDPDYVANAPTRCYHCKRTLWRHLVPVAQARGLAVVVDGTNADDLADWRPGGRAAQEWGVRSPLAELGFTKAEIRSRSRARGLATWDRPSSPCLASRLPYGTAVTRERLAAVERAEAAVRDLGIPGDLRVRHHGSRARIELSGEALEAWGAPDRLARLRDAVCSAGFTDACLDLSAFRSGSLNVLGAVTA